MSLKLSLSVTEQPSKLHRFRYLKEIKGNRMGSVLHSESSAKTPVKIRVACPEPLRAEWSLRLIVCTVFEDLTPHPFYLFGDDCRDGVLQKDFRISAGSSQCDVSLDRIGIVCTPKKPAKKMNEEGKAEDDFQMRIKKWNFFNKQAKANPFQGKDVNQLRLAMQVFVQVPDSMEWAAADCMPVMTDVISDAKIFSILTVDCVIPNSVFRRDQDVWLYMKDPLPAETAKRFEVSVQDEKQGFKIPNLRVKSVKKHLVVFNFSDVMSERCLAKNGSLDVRVLDVETGDASNSIKLQFQFPDSDEPDVKRRRQGKQRTMEPDLGDDPLQELMADYFVSGETVDMLDEIIGDVQMPASQYKSAKREISP